MRKKYVAMSLLASALALQCAMPAAARPSSETDDREVTTYVPGSSQSTVTVDANGVKTTESGTSVSENGSTIAVVVDATTPSGTPITSNEKGDVVIGDKIVDFADGSAATAGLPESAVNSIQAINAGQSLDTAITDVNLDGYHALTGTHAVVTRNAESGAVEDTATEVALYVPNLVDGLGQVSILYYNNSTGRWEVIPAAKVDAASKLVYATVPGSGTLSVVYKK